MMYREELMRGGLRVLWTNLTRCGSVSRLDRRRKRPVGGTRWREDL